LNDREEHAKMTNEMERSCIKEIEELKCIINALKEKINALERKLEKYPAEMNHIKCMNKELEERVQKFDKLTHQEIKAVLEAGEELPREPVACSSKGTGEELPREPVACSSKGAGEELPREPVACSSTAAGEKLPREREDCRGTATETKPTGTIKKQKQVEMKQYKCRICAKIFTTKRKLEEHHRKYGTTSHECEKCGKSFHQQATLNRQVHIHTQERPFKCKVCHRGYAHLISLRRNLTASVVTVRKKLGPQYPPVSR
jgi:DNA-directed RNA polymerase subunit RPC12/RpoP